MSAAALIEAIPDKERAIARLAAEQAELIAELHRHAVMAPQDACDTVLDRAAMVEAELATALHVPSRTAGTRVDVAPALTRRLPRTLAALRQGGRDGYRARVIAEETEALAAHAVAVSHAIEDRIFPRACEQTPTGLRRSLTRAVVAADPALAADRQQNAARDRRACFTPLPDAMAELRVVLPAPATAAVWNRIEHDARIAYGSGDPRTLDRCAPTLVEIVTGDGGGGGVTRRAKAHVLVTVSADTLLGVDDEPAELDGYGPISPDLARRIAAQADATWRRILTDPASGALLDYGRTTYTPPTALADFVIARDKTRTFPGRHIAATR